MNTKNLNPILGSLGVIISGIAGIIYGLFTTLHIVVLIMCLIMVVAGGILLLLAFKGKSPRWYMDESGDNIFSLIIIYFLTLILTYGFFQSFQIPPEYAHIPVLPDLLPTTLFPFMIWCWYMTVFFTVFYFTTH